MRKITEEIVQAFYGGVEKSIGNSEVVRRVDNTYFLLLHNNPIAKWDKGFIWITNAGWKTMTTKERLNGLHGVSIIQKKGTWYLNGREWDGSWIKIED